MNVIFTGLATDHDVRDEPHPGLGNEGFEIPMQVVEFDVEDVFKGAVARHVTVRSAADGGACGYGFAAGRRYTVFADLEAGMYLASLCSATTTGKIVPAVFGLSSGEAPDSSATHESDARRFPWVPLAIVAGGLLVLGALLAARRRRSV